MKFKALRVTETEKNVYSRKIDLCSIDDLPPGDLTIRVHYSSLNYKDALSATGNKGVTRSYPHTPGIDAAGTVTESRCAQFNEGDEVIVTGYDLGMNTSGGYGEYIRIPSDWAIHKPKELSFEECMTIGTAGITAAIALHKMELLGMVPTRGSIVVTGASGGVGSLATALLAKNGYDVIAVSGKESARNFLIHVGAKRVENRDYVDDTGDKPLLKSRWAGAIDTVGGNTLATLLKACSNEGVIASTGLVRSPVLHTTVFPFILNGISLVGVGSAETSIEIKRMLWEKLAGPWSIKEHLGKIGRTVSLEELNGTYIPMILEGKLTGRIVVKL